MSKIALGGALGLVTVLVLAGCIDMTPLQNEPADAGAESGFVVDAAAEQSCRACVLGADGPCTAEWAACRANEKCNLVALCSADRGCLLLTSLQDQTVCSLPCLEEHGLTSNTDPVIALAVQLNLCRNGKCKQACGGGD
ncbi:MAG TPA: hypothetical protein VI072_23290 [Polyangiaceae bacterium]